MSDQIDAIGALLDAVFGASSASEALERLGSVVLGMGKEPVIASLWLFDEPGRLRLEGVWAAAPTLFEPGMEIDVSITPDAGAVATALLSGRSVVSSEHDLDLGVLGDVFRAEAITSWIVWPVRADAAVEGMVAIGSAQPEAFVRDDLPIFTAVATAVGARLMRLVRADRT